MLTVKSLRLPLASLYEKQLVTLLILEMLTSTLELMFLMSLTTTQHLNFMKFMMMKH